MTIYIYTYENGTVIFELWEADTKKAEELFNKDFEESSRCNENNAFKVMQEIDEWYYCNFEEGCVRFEFG